MWNTVLHFAFPSKLPHDSDATGPRDPSVSSTSLEKATQTVSRGMAKGILCPSKPHSGCPSSMRSHRTWLSSAFYQRQSQPTFPSLLSPLLSSFSSRLSSESGKRLLATSHWPKRAQNSRRNQRSTIDENSRLKSPPISIFHPTTHVIH